MAVKRRKLEAAEEEEELMLDCEMRQAVHMLTSSVSGSGLWRLRGKTELAVLGRAMERKIRRIGEEIGEELGRELGQNAVVRDFALGIQERMRREKMGDMMKDCARTMMESVYGKISVEELRADFHRTIPFLNRKALLDAMRAAKAIDIAKNFDKDVKLTPTFLSMPTEIVLHIQGFLDLNELLTNYGMASRRNYQLVMSREFWRQIQNFRFGSRVLLAEDIGALVRKLSGLKFAKFGRHVPENRLVELFEQLHVLSDSIEALNFSTGPLALKDHTIFQLFSQSVVFSSLKDVNLSSCNALTDEGIRFLAEASPNLRNLNLKMCFRISDASLYSLSLHCKKLRMLTLRYCINISDDGLSVLARGCKNLEIVSFRNCVRISDHGIMELAIRCPLRRVSFSKCFNITDASLTSLAKYCPFLEYAHFAFCRLTDDGVCALAINCPKLKNLDISLCRRITDLSLEALAKHCPFLEHLCAKGCPSISESAARIVWEHCHNLEKLCMGDLPVIQDEDEGAEELNESE